uniref:G_PROTEIN_RECEP_F1_2 domain-containing protein n=1 Tax=Strongyloides stercoralis TaxID=6248 RepID=A0A0K0ETA7_STRER
MLELLKNKRRMDMFDIRVHDDYMSLESSELYNIIMFILGIFALILNTLDIVINISNCLYKQSLHNFVRLYSTIFSTILAIRNIVVSCANLCVFNGDWFFTSTDICLVRSIIDIIIFTSFEMAYVTEIVIFSISVVYPVFFMKNMDNIKTKIFSGLLVLTISIFSGLMLLVGRTDLSRQNTFCIIYINWTEPFQITHSFLTLLSLILAIVIYIRTKYEINKMSSEDKLRKNICDFMCWSMLFFMGFGMLPNILLVVSYFMAFDCNFKNICLDVVYLTISISLIVPFPFALWKNKLIRRHFLELPFVPKNIYERLTSKVSSITT